MILICLCLLVGFSVGRILGCAAAKKQFYRPLLNDHCAVCQCRLVEVLGVKIPECEAQRLLAEHATATKAEPTVADKAPVAWPPASGFERVRSSNDVDAKQRARRRVAA